MVASEPLPVRHSLVGVGFEKVMSSLVIERFGFTFDSALKARAVEYGSSFQLPLVN